MTRLIAFIYWRKLIEIVWLIYLRQTVWLIYRHRLYTWEDGIHLQKTVWLTYRKRGTLLTTKRGESLCNFGKHSSCVISCVILGNHCLCPSAIINIKAAFWVRPNPMSGTSSPCSPTMRTSTALPARRSWFPSSTRCCRRVSSVLSRLWASVST